MRTSARPLPPLRKSRTIPRARRLGDAAKRTAESLAYPRHRWKTGIRDQRPRASTSHSEEELFRTADRNAQEEQNARKKASPDRSGARQMRRIRRACRPCKREKEEGRSKRVGNGPARPESAPSLPEKGREFSSSPEDREQVPDFPLAKTEKETPIPRRPRPRARPRESNCF